MGGRVVITHRETRVYDEHGNLRIAFDAHGFARSYLPPAPPPPSVRGGFGSMLKEVR